MGAIEEGKSLGLQTMFLLTKPKFFIIMDDERMKLRKNQTYGMWRSIVLLEYEIRPSNQFALILQLYSRQHVLVRGCRNSASYEMQIKFATKSKRAPYHDTSTTTLTPRIALVLVSNAVPVALKTVRTI